MARQMFMLYTVNEISNMRKRISPLQYLAGESGDPSWGWIFRLGGVVTGVSTWPFFLRPGVLVLHIKHTQLPDDNNKHNGVHLECFSNKTFTGVLIKAWTRKIRMECLCRNQSLAKSSQHRNHKQRTVPYQSWNKLFCFVSTFSLFTSK